MSLLPAQTTSIGGCALPVVVGYGGVNSPRSEAAFNKPVPAFAFMIDRFTRKLIPRNVMLVLIVIIRVPDLRPTLSPRIIRPFWRSRGGIPVFGYLGNRFQAQIGLDERDLVTTPHRKRNELPLR